MATETKQKKSKPAAKTAAKKAEAAAPAASKGAAGPERNGLQRRREITGVVVSDKMNKTIVVKVDRSVRHSLYKKYVTRSRRFKAHDETNQAKIGDLVILVESRPLSREKRWALASIIRRSGQAPEVNV